MYDGNNSWRVNRMDKNYRMVTLIQDDLKKRYQAEDSAAGRNQICQGKMLWEMKKGKDKAILSYSLNSFLAAVMCADQKAFAEWDKKNESCLYHKGVGVLLERKLEADAKEPEDCIRGIVEEAVEEEAIARIWSVLLFPVWKKTEQSFFPLSSLEHAFQKAKKQEQRKIARELSLRDHGRDHGMKHLIFFRNEIKPYGTLTLTIKNLERIGIPEYMPFEQEWYDCPEPLWEQNQKEDREILRIWRITSIQIKRKEVLHTYQKELLELASRSVFLYARKCGLFPDEVLPQALAYARKSKKCMLLPLLIGMCGRKEEKRNEDGMEDEMEHGAGSIISCG